MTRHRAIRSALAAALVLGLGVLGAGTPAAPAAAAAPALLPAECPIPRQARDACYQSIAELALPAVWQAELAARGRSFAPARVVELTGAVMTACGDSTGAESSFYCDKDATIYLPVGIRSQYLRFYLRDLAGKPRLFARQAQRLGVSERRLRKDGSYGPVFEFAHEYGHHVQEIVGWGAWHRERTAAAPGFRQETRLMAAYELSADCLGGWWTTAADRAGQFPLTPLDAWSRRAMVLELATFGNWRLGVDFRPYVPLGDPVIRRSEGHGTVRQRMHMEGFGAGLTAGEDPLVRCATEAARITTTGEVPPL